MEQEGRAFVLYVYKDREFSKGAAEADYLKSSGRVPEAVSSLRHHVARAIITRPEQIQNITDSCKAGLYFVLCVCPFI